jgi:phosphoesterase RecJ-like protein
MRHLLEALGKSVILVAEGPWKRPEVKEFEGQFKTALSDEDRRGARAILVDCSALDRTGDDLYPQFSGIPTVYIDHHRTNAEIADSFVNTDAPAAAALVLALFDEFGVSLTAEIANILLLGLCTDTGFFRHIDPTQAEVFVDFEKLVRAGASPKDVYARINGGKTLAQRKLLAKIVLHTEEYYGGKLLVSTESMEETAEGDGGSRDSDTLYNLLQSVKGVEAVSVVRQESEGRCTIGFRSRDAVNVSDIARKFGGGGHKNASGAYACGQMEAIKREVIAAFAPIFGKQ